MFLKAALRCLVIVGLAGLLACGGGAERQAKYFERAQQFYDEGNFDKARIEVKNVLQINPKHAQGRYLLALLEEREQNWKGMYGNLNAAVEEDPKLVPARLKLGQLQLLNSMFDQAMEQADAVLALEPDNADARVLRASVWLRQGDTEKAVQEAELVLGVDAGHIGAIAVMTGVYQESAPDKALAYIEQGIQQHPEDVNLKLLQIHILQAQGRNDQVVAVYRELIEQNPDNVALRYRLVEFHRQQGQLDQAEAVARELVATKPDDVQAKLFLVQFLANSKGPKAAQQELEGYIAAQPQDVPLRFALAQLLLAQKELQPAQQAYRDIIALDDKGADAVKARNGLIAIALAQNEREPAEQLLAEVFELDAENGAALITRAKLHLMDKQVDEAISDLRTVQRNDPQSIEALLLLGRAYEMNGSRDLALDNYRQVLALQPKNLDALFNVGRLELARGQQEEAEDEFRALLEIQPENYQARRLLVTSLVSQKKWDMALEVNKPLLENDKTQALGYYLQGRALYGKEDYAGAVTALEKALAKEPAIVEALQYLLNAYARLDKLDQGMAYLNKHIEQYPDHAHAHRALGDYYRQSGDQEKAIAAYQRVLELSPTAPEAYQVLSGQYLLAGQLDKSIATLEQGVAQLPDQLGLQILLAAMYDRAGDYDKARTIYEGLLKTKPDLELAANNLATLLVDRFPGADNLKAAERLTEKLRDSQQPAFIDTVGWVNYKLGNYVRAVTLMETAQSLGGKGADYAYHLGMAYFKNNQPDKAREQLELALADDAVDFAGKDEARQTLEALKAGG